MEPFCDSESKPGHYQWLNQGEVSLLLSPDGSR
jgi:hypothetical protein